MRLLLVLVMAAIRARAIAVPAAAEEPATVSLEWTVESATIPPGPPPTGGVVTVTPSATSGQAITVVMPVPRPCGAPRFNR